MNRTPARRRIDLVRIATETMTERGLEPEFGADVVPPQCSMRFQRSEIKEDVAISPREGLNKSTDHTA